MDSGERSRWYSVRFLIELQTPGQGDTESSDRFEDRIILVRPEHEEEALTKGMDFATGADDQYVNSEGETVGWTFRHVVGAYEILDSGLQDGSEIYSAFVDRDLAEVLMRGGDSPIKAWVREHPGADRTNATVEEIAEVWETR
jgi:hypothetical protein